MASFGIPLQASTQDGAMNFHKHSMEKMNADMQNEMDPDPTKAWSRVMIAHHQGAIDMNRVVLNEIKDHEVRKMAEKTTGEEEAKLQSRLSKHRS